jgi:GAF domain-containing protein
MGTRTVELAAKQTHPPFRALLQNVPEGQARLMQFSGDPTDGTLVQTLQDLPSDGVLEHVTALAAAIFRVPTASVTIVDGDTTWVAAARGPEAVGPVLDLSGWAAVSGEGPYVVTDAAADPRTLDHPLVRGEPGLRFYASAPLVAGHRRLGTLDVLDREPRTVTPEQTAMLVSLAEIAAEHLDLRLAALVEPARCQLGGLRSCDLPPELKVADMWGDSAWGCLKHVEEALLSGSSVFVADRGMAGLVAFRRRGRTAG